MFGWGPSEPADGDPALSAVIPVADAGGDTQTLEERLQKLEAQVKQHSELISQLKQHSPSGDMTARSVPDSLSMQSVKGDVEQVVDSMRRDLASQRKMLDDFHEKLQPVRNDFLSNRDTLERLKTIDPSSLRSEFVSAVRFSEVCADMKLEMKVAAVANQNNNNNTNNSGISGTFGLQAIGDTITAAVETTLGKQQRSMGMNQNQDLGSIKRGLETYFVAKGVFDQTVAELRSSTKNDLATLHSLLEHTALKAGYLAVAASESSPEEKSHLFDTLKSKEKEIGSMSRGAPPGVRYPQSMSTIRASVNDLMQSYPPRREQSDVSTLAIRNNSRESAKSEIVVNVQKQPNMKLGMTLDGRDESSLLISGIGDGLVSLHNAATLASNNPSQALQLGDRIVAVNGARGSPSVLIQETKRDSGEWPSPDLQLTVIRGSSPQTPRFAPAAARGSPMPGEILVTLDSSSGNKLGLSVDCDDHQTLLISRINPGGLMDVWSDAHPGQRIMPRDRIVMANGKRGDPKALLEETQRGGVLNLGIIRNSQEGHG